MLYVNNPGTASAATGTSGDHAVLANLDYASANHSGFEPTVSKGALSAIAPLLTSGLGQIIGSPMTISMTTGILVVTAPLTTSGLAILPGTSRTIGITTGILNATGPLATSGLMVIPGAAGTISMTTGLLTASAPLTTSSTTILVGTGRTIAITTGILTMSAPMITSGQFTIPTGAATVSMQTATTSTNGYITSTDYNTFERITKSFVVYNPLGSATYPIWKTPTACTISSGNALVTGAGSSVTGQLQEADGNGASGIEISASGAINAATNTGLNLTNTGVDAGDYILWVTTATSGTPTSLSVSFTAVEA
jgi:hypothetical protein